MKHYPFQRIDNKLLTNKWDEENPDPNQLRWKSFDLPGENEDIDFVQVGYANDYHLDF